MWGAPKMRRHNRSADQAKSDRGFFLIEVLVALGIFAIVSIGALSVLGATAAGGFQDASPTALTTGRQAKDLTVAGVYLQALHDYLASQDDTVWDAVFATWPPGATEQTYCIRPGGTPCDGGEPVLPTLLGDYPIPESPPYQLNWTMVRILIQRWFWNCAPKRYAPDRPLPTRDVLVRVHSTLLWRFKDAIRTLAPGGRGVDRFLPYGSSVPLPSGEVCP